LIVSRVRPIAAASRSAIALNPVANATQGESDSVAITAVLSVVREPMRGSMRNSIRRLDTCAVVK
jgi:hypothetical protein